MGRPLGVPGDAVFQRKVLIAVLRLLESDRGPVLEDFQEDAPVLASPNEDAGEGWACPVNLAPPPAADGAADLGAALRAEIALLAPWYDLGVERRGRTTADSIGLDIDEIAAFLVAFLEAEPPSPRPDLAPGEALNLASEDLKAFYFEAATARPGGATSRQVTDWFWGETAAAKVFLALKEVCSKSDDEGIQRVGEWLLVPLTRAEMSAEKLLIGPESLLSHELDLTRSN